ncbi:Protein of unknown function (DUF2975) [Owenweeksia hongkongensis DSM 17368]|uniref:DUF2975 domain-containing protein n=1 Tax=Owenweeksia hongkongensis (strain DSM 17368 / CIP 108786 / JCM 12287 / NRRL B-23963 / UST20020801) TaxID=926562 RepID=G8R3P4_OWEHD|nr:DUF2975 domain-containing protein [Owenweeksia hongkongensis]AEV34131.1 Protein of unknown function (DUF2975) [Owenweeksia hongkongensis DSM 17368]
MNKLKIISGILYFAKWVTVAIGIVACAMILSMKGEPMIITSPSIGIADEQLQKSLDDVLNSFEGITLTVEHISAQVPSTYSLQIISAITLILKFGFILWVLQIIINLVDDVKNNKAFRSKNIIRLKQMAWLLILTPVIFSFIKFINLIAITSVYKLPDSLTYRWVDNTNFDSITVGFLIYAIAIAFNEGLQMKKENELTV